jgi:small GTP-binding protein
MKPSWGEKPILSQLRERIAESLVQNLLAGGAVVLLVVGRTGCGKSSTVNSLLGQEQAKVSPHERGTDRVATYSREIAGIDFLIVDTPGLGDIDPLQDRRTVAKLKALNMHINCLLYITALDQARQDKIDGYTLEALSAIFPDAIKERSVIVFTKADLVPEMEFAAKRHQWKRSLRKKLSKISSMSSWGVLDIPVVVISNGSKFNPDGEEWLDELLVTVMDRSDRRADIQILLLKKRDGHARQSR